MLRRALRAGLVAILGSGLIAVGPTPTAHATVAAPAEETLVAATAAVQRAATTAALVIRIVSGQTSWGLGVSRCGRGNAYQNGGVVVRSPAGAIRNPARIWPGDLATITCGRQASSPAGPTPRVAASRSGWVAPLASMPTCSTRFHAPRPGYLHQGIDLPRPSGYTIRAIAAGTVTIVKGQRDRSGRLIGAGWYVRIYHGHGISTVYMHMREKSWLVVGQRVLAGQPIGRVGNTGRSFGAHLHFEVHQQGHVDRVDGKDSLNPASFLRARGIFVRGC